MDDQQDSKDSKPTRARNPDYHGTLKKIDTCVGNAVAAHADSDLTRTNASTRITMFSGSDKSGHSEDNVRLVKGTVFTHGLTAADVNLSVWNYDPSREGIAPGTDFGVNTRRDIAAATISVGDGNSITTSNTKEINEMRSHRSGIPGQAQKNIDILQGMQADIKSCMDSKTTPAPLKKFEVKP